jgi:hypothetical protein
MTLFTSGVSLAVACSFEPLQVVLWGQKWAAASAAVMWMSAFFPLRLLTGILNAAQLSKGMYKEWFWMAFLQGGGMMLATALAAGLFESSGKIALVIGVYFLVGLTPIVFWGFARVGVPARAAAGAILPAWLVACGAAAATLAIATLFPAPAHMAPRLAAAVDLVLRDAVFGVLYLVALRAIMPKALAETIDIAPGRLCRPVNRLFLLMAPVPLKAGV